MQIFATLMGAAHRSSEAREIVKAFTGQEPLRLERDPDNAYDENAIKVYDEHTGEWIGFIERGIAEEVAPKLDAGERLDCTVHMVIDGGSGQLKPLLKIETHRDEEAEADGEGGES